MKNTFQRINKFFPLQKLLVLFLTMAIVVQFFVISYNHPSGFYTLDNITHFIVRLIRGVTLSLIAGFFIAIPDLIVIDFLNHAFQWNKKVFARILIQFLTTIIIAFIVSLGITLFANWISAYTENLNAVLLYNTLIYAVVNIILVVIFEGWLFYIESDKAKTKDPLSGY